MRRFVVGSVLLSALLVAAKVFAEAEIMDDSYQKATFAAGCFWGVEKVFSELPGVVSTQVGYTGGRVSKPSYLVVCTGLTGHAEAIEIIFNPKVISYAKLVQEFFRHHDPTTSNRQGPDIGSQYRSAIFYHDDDQKIAALKAVKLLDQAKIFKKPVVTEVSPAGTFWPAEGYHQKYLKKNPHGYCSLQLQSDKIAEVLKDG